MSALQHTHTLWLNPLTGGTELVPNEHALDDGDRDILRRRFYALETIAGPREGDFVRFADGAERRVSFVTPQEWLPDIDCVQTSDGGSFYLGEYGCSFSGSLHPGVRRETLTLTDERKEGPVWFFHHDSKRAHNGVPALVPFRVYECSSDAPA